MSNDCLNEKIKNLNEDKVIFDKKDYEIIDSFFKDKQISLENLKFDLKNGKFIDAYSKVQGLSDSMASIRQYFLQKFNLECNKN